MKFLSFVSLISFIYGSQQVEQLINLNTFIGGNVSNPFSRNESPCNIYVSASADDESLLSKIYLVNDDNQKISLNDLRLSRNANTGELQPFSVFSSGYLITNLTTSQLQTLTGFLFQSTRDQWSNNNFHVFEADDIQDISRYDTDQSTTLFLNSGRDNTGSQSSVTFSKWDQGDDARVNIYNGFRSSEREDVLIFSNPLAVQDIVMLFPKVETFSVPCRTFYIKSLGRISYRIQPGSQNLFATSSYTTTGLLVKGADQESSATYRILQDSQDFTGVTGFNTLAINNKNNTQVQVAVYNNPPDNSYYNTSVIPGNAVMSWSIPFVGDKLDIKSRRDNTSAIFTQFFIIQGPPRLTTTTQTPLTTTTQTSTTQTSTTQTSTQTPTTTTTLPTSTTTVKTTSTPTTTKPTQPTTNSSSTTTTTTTTTVATTTKVASVSKLFVSIVASWDCYRKTGKLSKMKFLSFVLLTSFIYGSQQVEQLINLNTFIGGNVSNSLPGQSSYGIYISASNDDESLLSQIYLVDYNNRMTSLNDVRLNTNSITGALQAYEVFISVYLITNLTTSQLQTLTGFMYLSTLNQDRNNYFHVYDVSYTQTISYQLNSQNPATITTLFLNSDNASSVTFSRWDQGLDAQVTLYDGFRSSVAERANTQIFANPLYFQNFGISFSNVETFSIPSRTFHMKSLGGISFRIQPGENQKLVATTAFTTTGLHVKRADQESSVTYRILQDSLDYTGVTGVNIVSTIPGSSSVQVAVYNNPPDNSYYNTSVIPGNAVMSWSIPFVGDKLDIKSRRDNTSTIFTQFFIIQGPPRLTTTTQTPPTTTTQTQTQTSASLTTTTLLSSTTIMKTTPTTTNPPQQATNSSSTTTTTTTTTVATTTKLASVSKLFASIVVTLSFVFLV
ncbi:hypothetical protein GCK72_020523 [Caenorhabditis remanei]|uniref:CUB-like domain-containing protein n=1 Tax=Caenorhabditis remanei TaxID=31234 RepID=A0A6A5GH22_CAERE|nr:hypothetical protein GCK72_020523 [Caenorhabditis remanei]KAF1753966.1 hypothetical protein GCK72_020523 [Caenorhabditis remanei]